MATTGTHQRKPGKRGKASGWSPGAARRNVAFLRSVDETTLAGVGVALTLTIRTCPLTSSEWNTARDTWIKRQRRNGLMRLHWVTEYQRNGNPHLHCAAWYDSEKLRRTMPANWQEGMNAIANSDPAWTDEARIASLCAVADWVAITQPTMGTGPKGQHSRPISGAVGWFMYLSKHCGRGRKHYQRQQEQLPAEWDKSPRVWGKSGDWITNEPASAGLTEKQWHRLRRLVRAQRVARVRAALPDVGWSWESAQPHLTRPQLRAAPIGTSGRGRPLQLLLRDLRHARQMLRCPDEKLSPVRGISEWVTQEQQQDLFRALV